MNTVIVLLGLAGLWFAFAFGVDQLSNAWWGWLILGYIYLCAGVGFVLAPLAWAVYWWTRATPAALQKNDSEIFDVAKELGYKPIGLGKHRQAARWPGNQIFQVEFAEKHLHLGDLPKAWGLV